MGSADGFMLAKARFLQNGFGLGSWNRFWFLGIPGQHIGSPLLPYLLAIGFRIIVNQPIRMFQLWRLIVVVGVIGSVSGIYKLTRTFVREPMKAKGIAQALFVSLLTLSLPSSLLFFPQVFGITREFGFASWSLFSPLYLGDGHRSVGFAVILTILFVAAQLLERWNLRTAVLMSGLVGLLLLIDSLSLLPLLLWLIVVMMFAILRHQRETSEIAEYCIRFIFIIFFGCLLVSFWFTPGYVLNLVGSPSLGGKSFLSVSIGIVQRYVVILPIIFGILIGKKMLKKLSNLTLLGLFGFIIFGVVTLVSYFADPDFWQDYTRFGRSLDLSIAFLIGGVVFQQKNIRRSFRLLFYWLLLIVLIYQTISLRGSGLMSEVGSIFESSEYQVGSELQQLLLSECKTSETCEERAYLSGSSAFWFNAWFPYAQVRGGSEMGSLNDWWPHGSFQIREGRTSDLTRLWLEAMGVEFVVVHGQDSDEIYHDFRHPSKFDEMDGWEATSKGEGNVIYQNNNSSFARVASQNLLSISSPQQGDDVEQLRQYVEQLNRQANFEWITQREFEIFATTTTGEGISVPVSYSAFWRIIESTVPAKLVRDPLGLMFIQLDGSGPISVRLRYSPFPDILSGMAFTIVAFFILLRKPNFIEDTGDKFRSFVGTDSDIDRTAL